MDLSVLGSNVNVESGGREIVRVHQTASFDVDQKIVVGKEISTEKRSVDFCDDKVPCICAPGELDGDLTRPVCLDGSSIGGDELIRSSGDGASLML